MPILRYFLFVGGTLFALLVLADAVLPSVPLPASLTSAADLPTVRIQSTRKWPERIVIDTSIATPAQTKVATVEPSAVVATAQPAKTAARDAYAQLNVAEAKAPTAAAVEKPPARAMKSSETAARPADAKKRKVAKTHPGKPMILVAQQPHFGLFNSTW